MRWLLGFSLVVVASVACTKPNPRSCADGLAAGRAIANASASPAATTVRFLPGEYLENIRISTGNILIVGTGATIDAAVASGVFTVLRGATVTIRGRLEMLGCRAILRRVEFGGGGRPFIVGDYSSLDGDRLHFNRVSYPLLMGLATVVRPACCSIDSRPTLSYVRLRTPADDGPPCVQHHHGSQAREPDDG